MATPVRRGDLVFDQGVHGFGVRDAEQRLGQAHQRDAFVGGQPVFREEHLHQTGLGAGADSADKIGPLGDDRGAGGGVQCGAGGQVAGQPDLIGQGFGFDHGPGGIGHGGPFHLRPAYTQKDRLNS